MIDFAVIYEVAVRGRYESQPKFAVNYAPGSYLAQKMENLDEGIFLDENENLRPSRTLVELITITTMKLLLSHDAYRHAVTIEYDGYGTLCFSRYRNATFYYLVRPTKIFLLNVIFDWDSPYLGDNSMKSQTTLGLASLE